MQSPGAQDLIWLCNCFYVSGSDCGFRLLFLPLLFRDTGAQSALRPVFGFVALLGLVELDVGVAFGVGKVARSKLKMGSPSSSKRWAVYMSQAGYLRERLTLGAKFESLSRRALSGVERRVWKC